MSIDEAFKKVLVALIKLYDEREAAQISDLLIEDITSKTKVNRIINRGQVLSNEQQILINQYLNQLLTHKPIQYVLNKAYFFKYEFFVNEDVLIPRPETEELVEWILNTTKKLNKDNLQILEIGSGSGCIAIALKKQIPWVNIFSIDVSNKALLVAQKNSINLNANVKWIELDFLNELNWNQLGKYDIIVSNPPYIQLSEKKNMKQNVINYEPSIALFVSDDSPLIFYEKIAAFSAKHLREKGQIFLEINEDYGEQTVQLLKKFNFNTELKKDLQGKDRMILAST